MELTISDDGIGFPEGFDYRTCQTLGLITVMGLGEQQLNGSVKIKSENGIRCLIRFSLDD